MKHNMPSGRSRTWVISEESFPVMAFERRKNPFHQPWACPSDDVIAAYVDGAPPAEGRIELEVHLAKCERCRSAVAGVVKLQREIDLPVPPFAAAEKVLAVRPRVRTRFGFLWAPAAGVAVILLVGAVVLFHREPQKLALTSSPAPAAPMIAKAEPGSPLNFGGGEITRQPLIPTIAPTILNPLPDSTVEREQLQFTWKPLGRSRYYEINVVTSDGDLLWAGKTRASSLRLPSSLVLKHGSYFVWVTAYLADGQVAKSSPIRFEVDR